MYRMSITRLPEVTRAGLLGCALLLAACSGSAEGPPVTQTRDVGEFSAVELRGSATLDVLVGTAASVTLVGDTRTLEKFTTRVQDGTLLVEQKSGWMWFTNGGDLQARITVPALRALTLNGAGNVSINGLAGGELVVTLQGAGNVEATGSLDALVAVMNGAGNMNFTRVTARDVTATTNGAGNLDVSASGKLVATVNGVGSINYAGKPAQVETAINGVGSISPR
jgi:hypothetical protein